MGKDLFGKNIGKGISQRKDGRYEARAVINGVKINLYNMNLSQLRKDFDIEKTKVLRNEKNNRSNMKLDEWFEEWFEKCKKPKLKSEASMKTYKRKIKNTYIRLLGKKEVENISQINIQDATNQLMQEEYGYRIIRESLNVLKECLDVAILNHMIIANPCQEIVIKEADITPKERRVLEHWEQDLFLEIAKNGFYYEPYAILLCTGLRIGEFAGLQWEDIDFVRKTITVKRSLQTTYVDKQKIERLSSPKTINGYRTIPFFSEVEQLLKEWKKKQNEYKHFAGVKWRCNPDFGNLVFTTTLGSPLNRYNIVHDIARIEKNMKLIEMSRAIDERREPREIKHIHPHAFRHTFATRCFEKKLEPLFVQRIMGHADYSTTTEYTHILDEMRQKEVLKMGNFLN